ncbi:MAG TPA: alpha/beta hydrolase [Solirubrobacteraceae bacterium]|jgi:pimeloyl-ACP methyl ester carboxylesterase
MPSLVTSDGRTLGWGERGSGPPLLCHPGGPGCSSAYFGELPVLAAQRTLLLLDPRGTGGSGRPADAVAYDLEQYAADVEAVREHLGLERLDVLGHSHGGFVAMTWAGANPERVGRLVLANTTPRFTDGIREARMERVRSHQDQPYYEDAVAAMRDHHEGRYADDAELLELYRRESPLFAPVGADLTLVGEAMSRAGINADALRHFNEHIAGQMDLRPLLARVAAPTLVIGGELDPFNSSTQEIAAALPDASVTIVPGADHFPFLEPERAAAWEQAVLDFLAAG